jgi:hypothetical protein
LSLSFVHNYLKKYLITNVVLFIKLLV